MDQMHTHGGGEKILSLKMNALVNNFNCEVFLRTTEQDNKSSVYTISEKINWKDFSINYYRSKSYFHPSNLFKIGIHFLKLKNEIKKIRPDVIVSVSQSPDQFFLPFIHKNIPIIKEFHSSGFINSKPISLFQKLKYKLFLLYGKYTKVIVLNKDEVQYYPFNNIMVISNFIEKKPLLILDQVQRKNIIISAGRIAQVKQFDHLIKAWSFIAKKYPNWEVHIYGDGNEKLSDVLNSSIKKQKIPNIYLKGATDRLNLKMRESSIYAMTSATECFPMVLLEALGCGLPVVSYDCPHGPSNIITNGEDGVLAEHNNVKEFSIKLSKIIEDEALRNIMKKNGIKNVCRFNEYIVMHQWLNLFENIDK